jgi:hypothetical protein
MIGTRRVFRAAVLAAFVAAVFPVSAAHAATPQCGTGCAALYNLLYGQSDVTSVAAPRGTSANVGEPVALKAASGTNQGEDWAVLDEGTVSDFYAAGLVSSGLNLHYGNDEVYEFDYVPYGVDSGLCLGVAGIAGNGSPVSLQTCGVSSHTLWAADAADQQQRLIPFINGSDTNFSAPYVLTADTAGITMATHNLSGAHGVIDDGQYWSTEYGILP